MKKVKFGVLQLIILIIVLNNISYSQIKSVNYQVNTIGKAELNLYVYLDEKNYEYLPRHFKSKPDYPTNINIQIVNAENGAPIGKMTIDDEPAGSGGNNYLIFRFSNSKEETIKELVEGKVPYYIKIDKNIVIHLEDSLDIETRQIIITPEVLKAATVNKLKLSQKQVDLLVKTQGGISFFYDNFINAGKQVDTDDSSKTNYLLSFSYHANLFKSLNWSISGRFSTKKDDPLNKFQFFPLNLNLFKQFRSLYVGADAQIGMESNQKFTLQRINVTGDLQTIIPNIVDFTNGANRLRLKPVVKIGLKGLFEYKKLQSNTVKSNDAQIFTEVFYYIPILSIYSFLIELNAFNTFKGQNGGNGWKAFYSLTLGVEIPKTDFKVIAKYQKGENDINYKIDSQLILGLMMDFLK